MFHFTNTVRYKLLRGFSGGFFRSFPFLLNLVKQRRALLLYRSLFQCFSFAFETRQFSALIFSRRQKEQGRPEQQRCCHSYGIPRSLTRLNSCHFLNPARDPVHLLGNLVTVI